MPGRMARRVRSLGISLLLCAVMAAGCERRNGGYYPLEAGRWWYYGVEETVLDEHRTNRYLALNLGQVGNSSEPVHVQMMQTRSADYLRARGAGVERVSHLRPGMPGPTPEPAAALPATQLLDVT